MKLALAIAKLLGVKVPDNATEDALVAAIESHKPEAPSNVAEINLADAATVTALTNALAPVIDQRITAETETLRNDLAAAKAEVDRLTKLGNSGALGAANGGNAIPGAAGNEGQQPKKDEKLSELRSQLADCKDPVERGKLTAQINKLKAA